MTGFCFKLIFKPVTQTLLMDYCCWCMVCIQTDCMCTAAAMLEGMICSYQQNGELFYSSVGACKKNAHMFILHLLGLVSILTVMCPDDLIVP